jgi:hypothetical protein
MDGDKPVLSNFYNAEGRGIAGPKPCRVKSLKRKAVRRFEIGVRYRAPKLTTFYVHQKKKPRLWGGALVFNSLRMKVVGRAGFEPA